MGCAGRWQRCAHQWGPSEHRQGERRLPQDGLRGVAALARAGQPLQPVDLLRIVRRELRRTVNLVCISDNRMCVMPLPRGFRSVGAQDSLHNLLCTLAILFPCDDCGGWHGTVAVAAAVALSTVAA